MWCFFHDLWYKINLYEDSIYFFIKFCGHFFCFWRHWILLYVFHTLNSLICYFIFFCNFTFYCCPIDNLHTSCSCLHSKYIYMYTVWSCKRSFFRLTISYINNVVQYTMYVINKINSCAKSGWYARHQHSYNICKDFLSHNSWMKNLNFTNSWEISKDYQFQ